MSTTPLADHLDDDEILDAYFEAKGLYYSTTRPGDLTTVVEDLGYSNLDHFFTDNPDAIEALYEFVKDNMLPVWSENLKQIISDSHGEEDESGEEEDDYGSP